MVVEVNCVFNKNGECWIAKPVLDATASTRKGEPPAIESWLKSGLVERFSKLGWVAPRFACMASYPYDNWKLHFPCLASLTSHKETECNYFVPSRQPTELPQTLETAT